MLSFYLYKGIIKVKNASRNERNKYMEKVKIQSEYIKLDQFLKWSGICDIGADAKILISQGKVKVNGNPEFQRGKKLRIGDKIEFELKIYEIE
jgi:ribosome-associated protein